jgi:hypothetical protein
MGLTVITNKNKGLQSVINCINLGVILHDIGLSNQTNHKACQYKGRAAILHPSCEGFVGSWYTL